MKIRHATSQHTDGIVRLYLQLKDHHAALAPDSPRYAAESENWIRYARAGIEEGTARTYVALRGSDVVGLVRFSFESKTWGLACEVESLVVDEAMRDQGIGRDLMRRAEEVARAEGALGMRVNVLHVNSEGRHFYERDGYRVVAVRYGKAL